MLKSLFAGAVDTVGGVILENIIKSTKSNGVVTCCGNVASPDLTLTVYPFILRGVSLLGIDSQSYSLDFREKIWEILSKDWKPSQLSDICREITLDSLQVNIELMLHGKLTGRTILNVSE